MTFFKENRKYFLAETVGTFLLVFLSVLTHHFIAPDSAVALLTYIVGVILLAHCIVGISGCHLNPVVSIGATLNKEINWKQCIGFVCSQIIGALVAGVLLGGIIKLGESEAAEIALFSAAPVAGLNIPYMLLLEFGLVFVFVLLVLGAVGIFERTKLGGIVVGITLVIEHLFAVVLPGASVNPSISIANVFLEFAHIGDALKDVWIYIVPTALGAVAAGLVGKYLYSHLHHAKAGQFAGHHVGGDEHGHQEHGEHHEHH